MALVAFGYAHLAIIAGIVLASAGLKGLIAHLGESPSRAAVWLLAAGVAIYLAGDALFRRFARVGPGRLRLAAAAVALLSAPLGLAVGGTIQLLSLLAVLVVMLVAERHTASALTASTA